MARVAQQQQGGAVQLGAAHAQDAGAQRVGCQLRSDLRGGEAGRGGEARAVAGGSGG